MMIAKMIGGGMNDADIVDAIARFRVAFKQIQLNTPTTILLESHDEGMRLLSHLRQTSNWTAVVGGRELGKPIEMADGSVFMEIEIVGMKVRWPANRIATPDGSWAYA